MAALDSGFPTLVVRPQLESNLNPFAKLYYPPRGSVQNTYWLKYVVRGEVGNNFIVKVFDNFLIVSERCRFYILAETTKSYPMATFKIEVTETLTRIITLEAATEEAALQHARGLYASEDIVLDSADFVEVEFGVGE